MPDDHPDGPVPSGSSFLVRLNGKLLHDPETGKWRVFYRKSQADQAYQEAKAKAEKAQ